MFDRSKSLGFAAVFILISAALHILAPLVGYFTTQSLMLVPIGIIYAVIAWFLPRNLRWLAWITFFVMLFGGIAALSGAMEIGSLPPGWWYWLIVAADWAAALMLFVYLWFQKPAAA